MQFATNLATLNQLYPNFMKKSLTALVAALFLSSAVSAQKVEFEEFTMDNGLHVILHQDKSAPVVVTSVLYHVGSKDENPERTGFAHFFEHLLFEGTENIPRGEWFKMVTSNGGHNNANTTEDRTYYYEVFPSNNLELSLWMESERMLQPVINQEGVDTQNEVVKEEKRLRVDNQPYGNFIAAVKENLFTKHPYRWAPIGSMEHLDAATLEEFYDFFRTYYVPNNAVLVVAGDIDYKETKALVEKYFSPIKKGPEVSKVNVKEDPITTEIKASFEDPNIQLPMYVTAYRLPAVTHEDSYALDLLIAYLTGGKSAPMYKKVVDEKKTAMELMAFTHPYLVEDYRMTMFAAIPTPGTTREQIQVDIDNEIAKVQKELISERDYQKLQNTIENAYVNQNSNLETLAENLATYHTIYKDANLINTEIEKYRAVTREQIKEVANKYLQSNSRLILDYVPAGE